MTYPLYPQDCGSAPYTSSSDNFPSAKLNYQGIMEYFATTPRARQARQMNVELHLLEPPKHSHEYLCRRMEQEQL